MKRLKILVNKFFIYILSFIILKLELLLSFLDQGTKLYTLQLGKFLKLTLNYILLRTKL